MRQIKTAFAVLLLSSAFVCAQAANNNDGEDFHGYWNLHLRGGAAHTVGETAYKNLISPAASAGFGYRITPVWGVRADFNGWQGKGATVAPSTLYSFKFIQANVDATVDICSIFAGFRSARVLNPYLLVGVGANARFGNDEAAQIKDRLNPDYFWEGTKFSPTGRAGVGLDIRLCDAVDLNLEVNTSFLTDKFNSKPGSIVDFQNNALLGLKFNFGKPKAKKASGASDGMAAAAAATAATAAAMAATEPKEEPVKPVEEKTTPVQQTPVKSKEDVKKESRVDVFFTIGKWDINPSEEAKVNDLISFLKADKDSKVMITGYADKDTGTADRNMFLSEKRAETIAAALINAGIAKDRITTDFKGSTEAPHDTPVKNRVAICIAK